MKGNSGVVHMHVGNRVRASKGAKRLLQLVVTAFAVGCGTDPADDATSGSTCGTEQVLCGENCTTVASDPLNCGQCGLACAEGMTCRNSSCVTGTSGTGGLGTGGVGTGGSVGFGGGVGFGGSVGTGGVGTGGVGTGGVGTGGVGTGGVGTGGVGIGGTGTGGVGTGGVGTGGTGTGGTGTGGTDAVGGGGTAGMAGEGTGGTDEIGGAGAGGTTIGTGPIYVSPSGDDTNPGTLEQPLRTLEKARDVVRTLNSTMTSDITAYLRGGTYPVTSTVTFSNADSGNDGFYVKYLAYPGERPLITGGQPITGWTLSDASNNIYSASGVTSRFRQLYVNGVKAIRARDPNLGPNGAPNFYQSLGVDRTAHNIQVSSSQVANWNNFTKVEMHMMLMWADSVLRLASHTTSGNTAYLTVQSPEDDIFYVRPYPQLEWPSATKYFHFENAFEFLDQPGEWYLDETANVLYYKPRDGEDMTTATVVAPMVETLLSVNGTSTSDQAGYLWFEGLTFAHSTYLRPSEYGFLDGQAGQYNLSATADNQQTVGRPGAGVTVTNANHIHFERNMFTQMAATGLDFVSGTHDDMIIGNVFTDIGGSGISIGKFTETETTEFHIPYNPTDVNEICTSDTIQNNYVDNVTTEIEGACGIVAGYPRYIDISHNEVSNTNYTGISVGFGWTTSPNAMSNNKINYNNVHDIEHIMADGAAIYTLSNQGPASEIQYNYLHDFAQSQWADFQIGGIYLDEGTTGYTVAHNVFVNATNAIFQNQTGTNTLLDNTGTSQDTISAAGIEPAYLDIKTMAIPVPEF
jgi:hypothetical protein